MKNLLVIVFTSVLCTSGLFSKNQEHIAFLHIDDHKKFVNKIKNTHLSNLWNDPEMSKFFNLNSSPNNPYIKNISDFLEIVNGSITISLNKNNLEKLIKNYKNHIFPNFQIQAQISNNAQELDKIMNSLKENLEKSYPNHIFAINQNNQEKSIVATTANANIDAKPPITVATWYTDGNTAYISKEKSDFSENIKNNQNADMTLDYNFKGIAKILANQVASISKNQNLPISIEKIFQTLKLEDLGNLNFNLFIKDENINYTAKLSYISNSKGLPALTNHLHSEKKLSLGDLYSSNSNSIITNLKLKPAIDNLIFIITKSFGQSAEQILGLVQTFTGINIEADLLPILGDQIISISQPANEKTQIPDTTFALAINDKNKMNEFITKLTKTLQLDDKMNEKIIAGKKIYAIKDLRNNINTKTKPPTVSYSISDEFFYLNIGNGDSLKIALKDDKEKFSQKAKDLADENIKENTFYIANKNIGDTIYNTLNMIKSAYDSKQIKQKFINFDNLPSKEKFLDTFRKSLEFGEKNSDSIIVNGFSY